MEPRDVLLSIDGKPVDNAGNIEVEGEKVVLHEVVERKFAGDEVALEFLRKGEKKAVDTLKAFLTRGFMRCVTANGPVSFSAGLCSNHWTSISLNLWV